MLTTHLSELEKLKSLGFPVNPLNKTAKNLQQVWQIVQEIEKNKNNFVYPIDGVVVKLNDNQLVENLGIIGKTPRAWCAVKFQTTEVVTKLLDITWQVGRTGKLTPVAILEPVKLLGTVVKRATLHNYQNVLNLKIKKGDFVVIRKAGEIIPEVVKVVLSN